MCDLSSLIIDLQGIRESEETFSFSLSDEYFRAIEAAEVRGGEIETTVKVSRKTGCFEVVITSRGDVSVDCARCLDPVRLPVSVSDKLTVKTGEAYLDEGDDIIIVPDSDPRLDLSWHIYEFIALSLPAQPTHPEGECNPEMLRILNNEDEEKAADPRWEKLASLKVES